MNDAMFELLQAWSAKETDWCLISTEDEAPVLAHVRIERLDGNWWYPVLAPEEVTTDDALMHIQHAAQQAIVARGYDLNLQYWDAGLGEGKRWSATLPNCHAYADNPAEALLRAYVAVLEKEGK
jgi:hypothetical protein